MSRYDDIKRIKSLEGKRYIRNAIYPDVPVTENDIYIKTTG